MARRPDIIFVYNVDLTLFALVSDFVHRLTAPEKELVSTAVRPGPRVAAPLR